MTKLTFILLAQSLFVYLSMTNENEIKEMYMSVEQDISFRIFDPTNTIGNLSFNTPSRCISMCLQILGCQIVTYESTRGTCVIYNSTVGNFDQTTGFITYTVINKTSTTYATVGNAKTTTSTTTTTVVVTTSPIPTPSCVITTFPSFDTNLLALWRFDNNSTDDNGSYSGTPHIISYTPAGYINSAVSLSTGDQSYIDTSSINLTSTNFTIEVWVRLSSPLSTNTMTILSQNDIILRISSTGVVYVSGTPSSTAMQLSAGVWYHIALVYDAMITRQSIYVNGAVYSTSNTPISSTISGRFYIGTYFDGSDFYDFFNGDIDHLSITTRIKCPNEILRDASLIASYSFEPPMNVRTDSGPYGNNAFFQGSGNLSDGPAGKAILFESGNYLQVSSATGLTQATDGFSFTFFIKPYNTGSCPLIYLSSTTDISDAGARPYLGINPSGQMVANIPSSVVAATSRSFIASEWTHVALTYSSSNNNVSLYWKGSLQTSAPGPAAYAPAIAAPPVYLTVGNSLNGSGSAEIAPGSFVGQLDEINIWSRELSAAEVMAAANP